MTELLIYGLLFFLLILHTFFAGKLYRKIHADPDLSFKEKNDWKLKALIFPAYYWGRYQNRNK
jgi:hypothetical protein